MDNNQDKDLQNENISHGLQGRNGGDQNNNYQGSDYNGQQQHNYQKNDSPGRGYSIACLVLGICGIVLCSCYGIVGDICSIVALVLHHKAVALDGGESSFAMAGKICAIVGIALSIIYFIIIATGVFSKIL